MRQISRFLPLLVLLDSKPVRADFNRFFFNAKANTSCPGSAFHCTAPLQICAFEPATAVTYCCDSPDDDGQCWTGSTDCSNSGTQTCQSQGTTWCCLSGRESCAIRNGLINICWSTLSNPLNSLPVASINASFTALAVASPTASTLSLNLRALLSTASTTLVASTVSGSSFPVTETVTATPSAEPTFAESSSSQNSPSSWARSIGFILGIVALFVVLVAAIGLCVCWRRRLRKRRQQSFYKRPAVAALAKDPPLQPVGAKGGESGFYAPVVMELPGEAAMGHRVEMPAEREAAELQGEEAPPPPPTTTTTTTTTATKGRTTRFA